MTISISSSNYYFFQFSSLFTAAFPPEVLRGAPQQCRRQLCLGSGSWGGFTAHPAWPQSSWQRISTEKLGWAHSLCPDRPGLTANVQEKDFLLSSGKKVIAGVLGVKIDQGPALQAPGPSSEGADAVLPGGQGTGQGAWVAPQQAP